MISSNDPYKALLEIPIQGFVSEAIAVTPREFQFLRLDKRKPIDAFEAIIHTDDKHHLPTFKDSTSSSAYLDAQVSRVSLPDRYIVHITIHKNVPIGPFEASVRVKFSDTTEQIVIPISGRVVGDYTATPETMYLDRMPKTSSTTHTITISDNTSIKSISISPEVLSNLIETTITDSNRCLLQFTPRTVGYTSGQIHLHLSDPAESEIVVPFYADVTDGNR